MIGGNLLKLSDQCWGSSSSCAADVALTRGMQQRSNGSISPKHAKRLRFAAAADSACRACNITNSYDRYRAVTCINTEGPRDSKASGTAQDAQLLSVAVWRLLGDVIQLT